MAELVITGRPSEPIVVFAADKTEPGAWNLPLYKIFCDPFNTAGLDARLPQRTADAVRARCEPPARFDGPPRVVAMGFQLADGRLVAPRDLIGNSSFDHARRTALEIADYMRRMGRFEPDRLPTEEMEYTTLPQVAARLADRWLPVQEPVPVARA